jgi:hypothetical protein
MLLKSLFQSPLLISGQLLEVLPDHHRLSGLMLNIPARSACHCATVLGVFLQRLKAFGIPIPVQSGGGLVFLSVGSFQLELSTDCR